MRLLLIGGGKVGAFLARELDDEGHVVSVIEQDEERAQDLAEDTKVLVFHGDGTDIELLTAADVDRADWVLAITGRDDANLVACQLALTLGAKRVLARLNNPRNRPTFQALAIPVVAVTDLMAQIITQEVEVSDLHRLALVAAGQLSLIERVLPARFPSTSLDDLELPEPSVVVAVVRSAEVVVPRGTTELRGGDRILAVTTLENETELCDYLDTHGSERRR